MSHTKSALIFAQQYEIKELQVEIRTLRQRQCEHCRDYYPVLRDDAIFVGDRQFTRDGLFSEFRPDSCWFNCSASIVFSNAEYIGLASYTINLHAHHATMTPESIKHFRITVTPLILKLCSHTHDQWERIFQEIRVKYGSNT